MTREELIQLGTKILDANTPDVERDECMHLFNQQVSHPSGSNLFFYPENYEARKGDLSEYNPTVEEVVDKCLSYRGIQL